MICSVSWPSSAKLLMKGKWTISCLCTQHRNVNKHITRNKYIMFIHWKEWNVDNVFHLFMHANAMYNISNVSNKWLHLAVIQSIPRIFVRRANMIKMRPFGDIYAKENNVDTIHPSNFSRRQSARQHVGKSWSILGVVRCAEVPVRPVSQWHIVGGMAYIAGLGRWFLADIQAFV